jgi:hypothetical protein
MSTAQASAERATIIRIDPRSVAGLGAHIVPPPQARGRSGDPNPLGRTSKNKAGILEQWAGSPATRCRERRVRVTDADIRGQERTPVPLPGPVSPNAKWWRGSCDCLGCDLQPGNTADARQTLRPTDRSRPRRPYWLRLPRLPGMADISGASWLGGHRSVALLLRPAARRPVLLASTVHHCARAAIGGPRALGAGRHEWRQRSRCICHNNLTGPAKVGRIIIPRERSSHVPEGKRVSEWRISILSTSSARSMGLFIIGCFSASIVQPLYIGGRHDYLHDMNARRY